MIHGFGFLGTRGVTEPGANDGGDDTRTYRRFSSSGLMLSPGFLLDSHTYPSSWFDVIRWWLCSGSVPTPPASARLRLLFSRHIQALTG